MQRQWLRPATGASTATHLETEAGSLPLLEAQHARAQLVGTDQLVQRLRGITATAEGAIAFTVLVTCIGLVEGDEDRLDALPARGKADGPGLGRRAQPPVVQRRTLLHPARFLEQRPDLACRLHPFDPADLPGQLRLLGGPMIAIEVRQDPVVQVDALADIQQHVILAVEQVDTGRLRQLVRQRGIELRRQARRLHQLAGNGFHPGPVAVPAPEPEQLGQDTRIAQGTMACAAGQSMTFHHRIQAVAARARVHAPRQLHRAQHRRAEPEPGAAELAAQEAVVETRVVGHEQAALEPRHHLGRKFPESRGIGHHRVADAGELLDQAGDAASRIHQRAPLLDDRAVLDQHDAHLDHAVVERVAACRLQVYAGERAVQQSCHQARGSPSESSGAYRSGRRSRNTPQAWR